MKMNSLCIMFQLAGTPWDFELAIQILSYNSLFVAYQNLPITSNFTDCTLGWWKDFDIDLSPIGSKEMIWKTCYALKEYEFFMINHFYVLSMNLHQEL